MLERANGGNWRALPGSDLGDCSAEAGRVFRALRPGGFHFADFKGGGSEGRDVYGRYFNYPTRAEVETAYAVSGGWEVLSTEEYVGGGYDGRQTPWVAITARRPF